LLTKDRVLELLTYNPEEGSFSYRIDRGPNAKLGQTAGTLCQDGYVAVTIDRKKYKCHVLVWLVETGELPDSQLDHKDRQRSNNRFSNLRKATSSQQIANTSKRSNLTSKYKGVHWKKSDSAWRACIVVNGKQIHIGQFKTEEEAAMKYNEYASKYYGQYAWLNTIHPAVCDEAIMVEV
jgi:hypothetical protein